jgi:hypothetical protein
MHASTSGEFAVGMQQRRDYSQRAAKWQSVVGCRLSVSGYFKSHNFKFEMAGL